MRSSGRTEADTFPLNPAHWKPHYVSNLTVSRLGADNGGVDKKALFLKQFGGEVIVSFNAATVFLDKHTVRMIENGKSAQFPATGKTTASYHTPGAEIAGASIAHSERVITIDDLLIANVAIPNIDEAMNHYDVRGEYSRQLGDALAQAFDKNVAQVGVLAARASATIAGDAGGSILYNADFDTDSDKLAAGMFSAQQTLDEKNVPDGERYVFLRPAQYYLAAQNTKILNKDWGGSGAYSTGKFEAVAGLTVVKTNNLPSTNVNAGPTAYQGDFTNTVGLVMNKTAVGTVKLLDLAMESEYSVRHQGTLMVAKYAMGHGILQPKAAVELRAATAP